MRALLITGILAMILAGCGGSDGSSLPNTAVPETPLPTVEEQEPTATNPSVAEPTLEVEATVDENLPTNTPFIRQTLPPTWTATLAPSDTPLPTATMTSTPRPTAIVPTTPPYCTQFTVDEEASTSEFNVGSQPTIAWIEVEGAELYRIYVVNEADEEVHMQLVEGLSYDIPADVFAEAGLYGWTVEPLDPLGIQMCLGRGEVLIAQ